LDIVTNAEIQSKAIEMKRSLPEDEETEDEETDGGLPARKRKKSRAEIQDAYRRRKRDCREIKVQVPTSPGLARVENPHVVIDDEDAVVVNHRGDVLIRVWKKKITDDHLRVLARSTERLLEANAPKDTFHLGSWRESSKTVEKTADSRLPGVERWLEKNRRLFRSVSWTFEKTWPDLHQHYTSVPAPLKVGAWSTVTLNADVGQKDPHFDWKDYRDGYCWVVPFGDFRRGGELHFPGLNVTIKMRPGMLVAFRSYDLEHEVKRYKGKRNSLVFHQHQTMFFDME